MPHCVRRVAAPSFDIFRELPPDTVVKLLDGLPSRTYRKGEILLREDQANDRVFLIESGELDVWKGEPMTRQGVKLSTLQAGSCFGEMSAVNGATATANIVAATPAKVRTLGLDDLPAQGTVQKQVTLNLARMLVDRLSQATTSLKKRHESELHALKVVASASAFLTRILTALSFYMLVMPLLLFIRPLIPSDSLISFFFIAAFLWVVLDFLKQTQIPLARFHITTGQWPKHVLTGLAWSTPFMALFFFVKIGLVRQDSGVTAIFEPMLTLAARRDAGLALWSGFALTYAALCFAQEFIRCAVQGTLDMIAIPATTGTHWKSILVSDVVFASMHMHLGSTFALFAFIAGLMFGYMFWRTKSYLAVATAHAALGVWAIFIVGIPH